MEPLIMLGAGIILGSFYFGGLWLTVGIVARHRAPAFLRVSQGIRLAGLGAGLLALGASVPEVLIPCLAGVLVARLVLVAAIGRAFHAA